MENPEISLEDNYVDYKPRIGLTFTSENEAYDFYNQYGRIAGFSIKRDYAHKSKEDKTIIKQRRFSCNKEGHRDKDKRDNCTIKPRAETRTECPARMCISRLDNGFYECRDFDDNHNHLLHTPATTHLMRSQRKITDVSAYAIDLADDSGIRTKANYDLLSRQAGGRENLGYTREDIQNYLRTKRQRHLAYGEAGSLLAYFQKQTRLNPSFIHDLQLDSEEQITNIFWADPRMIIDYGLFGDVVVFDTTFCTNKECRPFGIFAGFNHHKCVTIFGAALLYDETAESFKWLFETFLKANCQKKPITIFTDQDAAMSKAISEILPQTWHGLCTWHIMQNGVTHLGNLMKNGSSFLKDFTKCIYGYKVEEEFENAWKKLQDDYEVQNNSWLDRLYGIKEKWAACYMKNTFTLGVRSTQLSESINADLKRYLRPNLDLVQFFNHFERLVEDKRANELSDEFQAKNTLPRLKSKAPLMIQAAKVYTPNIFEKFEDEYNWLGACSLVLRNGNDVFSEYTIRLKDEVGNLIKGEYTVTYNHSEQSILCTCRKFETFGILCCHALKVFDILEIKFIPEKYILRRWTRGARSLLVEDNKGKQVIEDINLSHTQRYKFLCQTYVKLVSHASNSTEGFEIAKKCAEQLRVQLVDLVEDNLNVEALGGCNYGENRNLVLKKKESHKGSKKRHKGWIENLGQKNKSKKKVKSNEQVKSQHSVEIDTSKQSSSVANMQGTLQAIEDYQGPFMSLLQARFNILLFFFYIAF